MTSRDGAVSGNVFNGAVAYRAGAAAEDIVARRYTDAGHSVVAKRWRGAGGEIDLIVTRGGGFVFVEVKKSATFASAAARISGRQAHRICLSSEDFLDRHGADPFCERRYDVALVNAAGDVEIVENAFSGLI